MATQFLDKNGLTYFWKKLKALLGNKSDKGHTHSASEVSGLANVAKSGNYSDLNNKPIISNKANTGSETWYFPLGTMVIDNSSNYGNFTFTGRIGGWTNANTAVYSIMLMNRANYTGDIITATVSASGQVTNALAICDIVVAKNSDLSHTVYLKCNGYFCFDFAWTSYQHSIIYNGSYITTEPSGIIWRLSTAPKTILGADGSFTASGGIGGLATVATSGNYNDLKGKPTILVASNNGYNGAITAGGDGVVEMGKYIDFHNTASETSDYSTRLVCTGEHGNTVNLPSTTGTLIVGDRALKLVITSSAPTTDDISVMTVVL